MKLHAPRVPISARHFAVGLAGYCAFINLYSPQAVLPLLAQEFGVTAAEIAGVMTAGTLSVALIAPFTVPLPMCSAASA